MKNLLIFVNPSGSFSKEADILIKIQIDNSFDLGWKKEDIILATNFEFEYNGVKSIKVRDDNFMPHYKQGSKHTAILELIKKGIINQKELYWFHDLDAYQSEKITESELQIKKADFALTDYGRMKRLNTGSLFFKSSASDIFKKIAQTEKALSIGDEHALDVLLGKGDIAKERIKRLNISYNFTYFDLRYCYEIAIKPIKVVHFHPFGAYRWLFIDKLLDYYMYGKNELNTVLMPDRLIKIFKSHGCS